MENDAENPNRKAPQISVNLQKSKMNSQSNGRSQRPKGKRVKLAFQIGSVLAVCLWMLYQAKQSHDTNYSGSVQNEHGSGILGRKVNAGSSSSLVGEGVNDEVRGGGVDVSDGNVEKKHKVGDDTHGDLGGIESEKGVELKYKELNNADDNSAIGLKANSEENLMQEGNSQIGHEDKESLTKSDQNGEKDVEDTSHHEVGEDEDEMSHVNHDEQGHGSDAQESVTKDLSSENEFIVQPTEGKNNYLQDHNSMVDGVHGFDDETGVPVDGNDIIELSVTESNGDGEISLHEEMYTTSSRQNETNGGTHSEEVVARGDNANFEARSKISVQDSEHEAETNYETSVHVDTSRINSMNVTTKGGTSVSDP